MSNIKLRKITILLLGSHYFDNGPLSIAMGSHHQRVDFPYTLILGSFGSEGYYICYVSAGPTHDQPPVWASASGPNRPIPHRGSTDAPWQPASAGTSSQTNSRPRAS